MVGKREAEWTHCGGALTGNRDRFIREIQEELFFKQGHGWFRVVSGSMRPLIEIGDRVLVKRSATNSVHRGHIILFRSQDALVTHRVVHVSRGNGRNLILQRGDTGGAAMPIASESVLGRVAAIEKEGRILRLDQGRIKMLNHFLGLQNVFTYRVHRETASAKQWLRGQAGFEYMRSLYRTLRRPFGFLNGFVVRMLINKRSLNS